MTGNNSSTQSILTNSRTLASFACLAAVCIGLTFNFTMDTIRQQKIAAEKKALLEIFPQQTHNNKLLEDRISIEDKHFLALDKQQFIYIVRLDNTPIGFVLPVVAPNGYTDKITLIIGVRVDGSIAGLRILSHRETPGLGDKVELDKSNWVLSFNDKSLHSPSPEHWKVKKDGGHFDQFTGATITPRAIVNAALNALQYYRVNSKKLLNIAQSITPTEDGSQHQPNTSDLQIDTAAKPEHNAL